RVISDLEGDMNKNVEAYTDPGTPEFKNMVGEICRRLSLDSLKFSTIETLVKSIGLPKEDLCLHCFDGSSAFSLEEENK
ncbi:MAG: amidophosphoribosyltransferase, partial [Candidatus Cryptobacteroides sp.]|nr:amidophosphoribosyltransferase [Candidatus Cryptobacteroides sp.]